MMEEERKYNNSANGTGIKKYKSLKNKIIKKFRKAKQNQWNDDQCKKNYILKTVMV